MQDINKFIKGMNSDVHPSIQAPNTSREVDNFVPFEVEEDEEGEEDDEDGF